MDDLGRRIRRVALRRKSLVIRRGVLKRELEATKSMADNARTEIRNREADLDYLDTKITQLAEALKKIDGELDALGADAQRRV